MRITGLKPLRAKLEEALPQDHALFAVHEAWANHRFKKYQRKTALERWTIDRHDTESGVVRVERVSARLSVDDLTGGIKGAKAALAEVDDLGWWDVDTVRNEHLDAPDLAAILHLDGVGSPDQVEDQILENAVYLVLVHTKTSRDGKATETIAATFLHTRYARNLAKNLYENLVASAGAQKGTP